jgi:hypothetical protein
LLHDLRFALRVLLKSREFTAVVVVAMALGIDVDTTIFTIVNAVVFSVGGDGRADFRCHLHSARRRDSACVLRSGAARYARGSRGRAANGVKSAATDSLFFGGGFPCVTL